MNNVELEYKYKADNVKLTDFLKLMEKLGYEKYLDISSWDIYYTDVNDSDSFMRLRLSDTPELTRKKKTKESNNWNRVEVDLPLDASRLKVYTVDAFAELIGYKRAKKIYKSCFIYWQKAINYAYYIVYDEDMKEIGRFVEVEVNKDNMPEEVTSMVLNEAEKKLTDLGLTPQNRMKRSLFELFVRE